jgi:Flp pilus assembly pilin Flp
MRLIARFLSEEKGAVATEYAVMLALILMGVFAAVTAVGGQSGGMWSGIVSRITGAGISAE